MRTFAWLTSLYHMNHVLLPSILGDVVARLLEKDPAARYPKTSVLPAHLEAVAAELEAGRVGEGTAEGAADEGP